MKKESQAAQILRNEILRRNLATENQLDGEITKTFIDKCHSKVLEYLNLARAEEVEQVINHPAKIEQNKQYLRLSKAQKMWSSGTQEDVQRITAIGAEWQKSFPQFDTRIESNVTALLEHIKQRNEDVTFVTLTEAFSVLAANGSLYLNPEAVGLEGGESIRGKMLTNRPDFHLFLKSYTPKTDAEREADRIRHMSADSFKAEFLPDTDILPPLVEKSIQKAIKVFQAQHPEYEGSDESRAIMLGFIRSQRLEVSYNTLEYAYEQNQKQLQEIGAINPDNLPMKYGISTLIEHPVRKEPAPSRSVEIGEIAKAKRFSMQEILSWDANTMAEMMQQYPELQRQIDSM